MPLEIKKTSIDGLVLIKPHVFEDKRGYFIKDFEKRFFEENGLPTTFMEFNESKSIKGTIRGLHFQTKHPQGKLIRVIKGRVYDVAVDLRKNSPTFGKWEGFYLSEENHSVLYIPAGFAHGFMALDEENIFSYKCTDIYAPKYDSGIKFDDEEIGVKWPFEELDCEILVSEKDMLLQSFKEFQNSGGIECE